MHNDIDFSSLDGMANAWAVPRICGAKGFNVSFQFSSGWIDHDRRFCCVFFRVRRVIFYLFQVPCLYEKKFMRQNQQDKEEETSTSGKCHR